MKNVTLVCLNSKFVHTSLGIWYIREYCKSDADFYMMDTFVNRPTADIVDEIVDSKPDIAGFSVYIFNVNKTVEVIKEVKKRGIEVAIGGPEATFNKELWRIADRVILNEGEKAWKKLLNGDESRVIYGEPVTDIIYPYTDEYFENAKNRIVYFEASRGCPFSCSYCMSANTKLIQFPIEKVINQLKKFKNRHIKLIKFVDRTFNADRRVCNEIMKSIIDEFSDSGTRFHFEVAPGLFDEELLATIARAPKGLFQFEAGYQSFCKPALEAVHRSADMRKAAKNIETIVAGGNCHVHTDLIVGLPYETYALFAKSFDRLFSLGAHQIQVGFLKVLKGSELERELPDGYRVNEFAPYEITETPWLSAEETAKLKKVEVAVESVYNSHRFDETVRYGLTLATPFRLFTALGEYVVDFAQLFDVYAAVKKCLIGLGGDGETICNLLKFDYLRSNISKVLPPSVGHKFDKNFKSKIKPFKDAAPDLRFYAFGVNPVSLEKKPCTIGFSREIDDEILNLYGYSVF